MAKPSVGAVNPAGDPQDVPGLMAWAPLINETRPPLALRPLMVALEIEALPAERLPACKAPETLALPSVPLPVTVRLPLTPTVPRFDWPGTASVPLAEIFPAETGPLTVTPVAVMALAWVAPVTVSGPLTAAVAAVMEAAISEGFWTETAVERAAVNGVPPAMLTVTTMVKTVSAESGPEVHRPVSLGVADCWPWAAFE